MCNLSELSDNHITMISTSWYKPGQTPGSVLGEVSSSMEECRAETVALYRKPGPWTSIFLIPSFSGLVVSEPAILKIFNVGGQKLLWSNQCPLRPLKYTNRQDVEDIQYITFLLMARAGLRALEFYDPVTRKHGQAHMQARWHFQAIWRWLQLTCPSGLE